MPACGGPISTLGDHLEANGQGPGHPGARSLKITKALRRARRPNRARWLPGARRLRPMRPTTPQRSVTPPRSAAPPHPATPPRSMASDPAAPSDSAASDDSAARGSAYTTSQGREAAAAESACLPNLLTKSYRMTTADFLSDIMVFLYAVFRSRCCCLAPTCQVLELAPRAAPRSHSCR